MAGKYRDRGPQYESPRYTEIVARIAANARRLRTERGWTQEEAAFRSGEMSTYLYQLVESGTTNPTATTLARICDGFDVDVAELVMRATPLAARTGGRPRKANVPESPDDPEE